MSVSSQQVRPPPAASGVGDPRPRRGASSQARLTAALFIAPALLLVGLLLLVPFLATVWRSLTDDDGVGDPVFVGPANYLALVGDAAFTRSLVNTLLWTAGTLLLPVLLGLGIAVLTSGPGLARLARYAFVLPYALSGTATAVVWGFILRTDGALNQALGAVGLQSLQTSWLLEWPTSTVVMVLANTWQAVGIAVILFLVGLQAVPAETVEAGRLDGAAGLSLFWYVIFPQLRPVTVVVVGISLANSLRVFDLIWLLTGGGPGRATETLAVTMYRQTFTLSDYGSGAAVAVVLAVIVVAVSWLYLRRQMPAAR